MKLLIKLSLSLLMLSTPPVWAQVSSGDAKELFEEIHHIMAPRLVEKNIVVDLEISQTKFPGAYAKWTKHTKIGQITLSPELLEMKEVTQEVLTLLICHEFGHFLGGAPTITQRTSNLATMARMMRNPFEKLTVEGQADFFATSSCYKEIQQKEKTNEQMKDDLDQFVQVLMSLMRMQDIHVPDIAPHRETPSLAKATQTLDQMGEYPSLQCRLDTLLKGLECSGVEASTGQCYEAEIERPACWYKSEN